MSPHTERPANHAALAALEALTLDSIAAASDEAALDAMHVGALGRKGRVSALVATLGKMDPEARKVRGAAFNSLKGAIVGAIEARKAVLKQTALEARLKAEVIDETASDRLPARGREASSDSKILSNHNRIG